MTRDKKSYIAAAIAAIIIVLISIPSIMFIGSVAYAEESDPIQTASKFVSDGDVVTVNYYDQNMDRIATKQIPANGSVPTVIGCDDYTILQHTPIITQSGIGIDGAFVSMDDVNDYINDIDYEIGAAMSNYIADQNAFVIAIGKSGIGENAEIVLHFNASEYALSTAEPSANADGTTIAIECDSDNIMIVFQNIPNDTIDTISFDSVIVDDVQYVKNGMFAFNVTNAELYYYRSIVDVVNVVVNDYDGSSVQFLEFSSDVIAGDPDKTATVNYYTPDMKKISTAVVAADQTIPVLAGCNDYTIIQKIPYGRVDGYYFDGEYTNDDSIKISFYGAMTTISGAGDYPYFQILGDFENFYLAENTVDIVYSYNNEIVDWSVNQSDISYVGQCSFVSADRYIGFRSNYAFGSNIKLISFSVNGYDYVNDGLLQFDYSAQQIAGFAPNTNVVNIIVNDYSDPVPDDPTGGDTDEIEQPENPTEISDGSWWDEIVAWFADLGAKIKSWFEDIAECFRQLFS